RGARASPGAALGLVSRVFESRVQGEGDPGIQGPALHGARPRRPARAPPSLLARSRSALGPSPSRREYGAPPDPVLSCSHGGRLGGAGDGVPERGDHLRCHAGEYLLYPVAAVIVRLSLAPF